MSDYTTRDAVQAAFDGNTAQFKDAINSDRCCGIICFPFLKKRFIEAGIMSHKYSLLTQL